MALEKSRVQTRLLDELNYLIRTSHTLRVTVIATDTITCAVVVFALAGAKARVTAVSNLFGSVASVDAAAIVRMAVAALCGKVARVLPPSR